MRLHKYKNIEEYKRIQEEGNIRKLHKTGISEERIKYLSEYIKSQIENPQFGICHGTRRGDEQKFFRKYLGIEVIGTEISKTATQFPHTIQWDFHDVKDEWIGNTDFIFSNALDHSYAPKMALQKWMSCLKPDGLCILFHTKWHNMGSELDPFEANEEEYKGLIDEVGTLHDVLLRNKQSRIFIIKHKRVDKK